VAPGGRMGAVSVQVDGEQQATVGHGRLILFSAYGPSRDPSHGTK
jgi:hypothetical protein